MAEDLETFVVHNETDARAYGLAMARAWHSFVQNRATRAPLPSRSDWLNPSLFSPEGLQYWGHAMCVFDGELETLDSVFL